jgi:hypothetical protein
MAPKPAWSRTGGVNLRSGHWEEPSTHPWWSVLLPLGTWWVCGWRGWVSFPVLNLTELICPLPGPAPHSAAGPCLPAGEGPTGCRRERERKQERGRSQERRQPSSSSSEKQRFYSCDRFGSREPQQPKPSLSSHPTSPTAGLEPGPHPQVTSTEQCGLQVLTHLSLGLTHHPEGQVSSTYLPCSLPSPYLPPQVLCL